MLAFLIIGGIGIVLLLISVIVGDVLGGALDSLGAGSDWLTGAVAGFLGAFGFGAALALGASGSMPVAVVVGIIAGLALGALAGWGTKRLQRGGDGGTDRSPALVGLAGTVISDIPATGFGEVSVVVGGHPTKLNARSPEPLRAGHAVIVDAVLSPTTVTVVRRTV